jgi:chromosome segregation ATPase
MLITTFADAETDADLEQLRMLKSMIEQKEQRIRELEANIDKLRSSFSDEEATLKARIKAAVNEQERAESELRKANSEKSELALRLQSRSLAVEQFDKNVEKLRATISQLHDELDDKARHSSDLQRQLDAKVRVTDELQEEVEEQAKSIVSLRTQLADQFRVAQELQNKLDDKERGRASLQRQLSDSKLSAEQVLSEKTRSLVGDVQRKLEEEEKAKLALAEQLRHSKLAIAQTMSSLAAAEERTKLVEPLKEQLAASNELAQSLRVQLAQLTDERTQIQENVAELQKKLMDAKREHDTQNSEHKELVQQQRRDAEAAASLQKRISELTSALDEAREESSGKSELIDDLQAEVESKNSVIDSQRKQMLEDTSIHKKLRALIDNHERILSEQSATISSLTDQLNEKDSKIFTLQREVDEAKLRESSHASQHNGSLDAYARQITQLNGAIDELKRTNSEKDIRLSTITSKNGDAESIIAQLRTDLQLQKEQAERSAQRAKADMQENRRALGVQQEAQEQLNVILETLRTSVQTLKVQVEEKSSVISAQQQLVEQLQAQLAEVPPDQSQAFVKRLVSLILEFPEGTSQPLPITVESGTDRLRQLILALLAKLVSRQAPAGSVRSPSSSPARQRSYSAIPFKPASAVVPTLNTSGSRSRPPSPPRSNGTNSPSMQESPPISPRTEGSAESDDSLLNNSGLTVDSSGSGDESRIDGLISRFGQSSRSAADRRRSWRAEESLIRAKLGAQAKGELTDAAKAEADVLASTSGRRNSNTPALPPGLRRALARSATISGSSYSRSNESDDGTCSGAITGWWPLFLMLSLPIDRY